MSHLKSFCDLVDLVKQSAKQNNIDLNPMPFFKSQKLLDKKLQNIVSQKINITPEPKIEKIQPQCDKKPARYEFEKYIVLPDEFYN